MTTLNEKVAVLVIKEIAPLIVTTDKHIPAVVTAHVNNIISDLTATGKKLPAQKAIAAIVKNSIITELTDLANTSKAYYVHTETKNKGVAPIHNGGYETEYTERLVLESIDPTIADVAHLHLRRLEVEGEKEFHVLVDQLHDELAGQGLLDTAKLAYKYRIVTVENTTWSDMVGLAKSKLTGKALTYAQALVNDIVSSTSTYTKHDNGVAVKIVKNYLGEIISSTPVVEESVATAEAVGVPAEQIITNEQQLEAFLEVEPAIGETPVAEATTNTIVPEEENTMTNTNDLAATIAAAVQAAMGSTVSPLDTKVNNVLEAVQAMQEVILTQAVEIAELQAAQSAPVAPVVAPAPVAPATPVVPVHPVVAPQAQTAPVAEVVTPQPVKEEVPMTDAELRAAVEATKLSPALEAKIAAGEITEAKAYALRQTYYSTNVMMAKGVDAAHKGINATEGALLKTTEFVAGVLHKTVDVSKTVVDKVVTVSASGAHKAVDAVAPVATTVATVAQTATAATIDKTKEVASAVKNSTPVQATVEATQTAVNTVEQAVSQAVNTVTQTAMPQAPQAQIVEIAGVQYIIANGVATPIAKA